MLFFFCVCAQVAFVAWQVERAQTGRLHVQAYVRFKRNVAVSRVRALVAPGHVEVARGTEQDNIKYCSKEESRVCGPWQHGKEKAQGKRNDIMMVREAIKQGKGLREIAQEATSYQGLRSAQLLLSYLEPGRNFKPEVRWYYGSTGSGKTRAAIEEFPQAYMSGKDGKWFDGYDAHPVCIIDDFRKSFCAFDVLLRLIDRYPFRVECKGGSRQFLARVIIFTCPWHPKILYENHPDEAIEQLMRRIDVEKQFGQIVPPPQYHSVGACAPHFRK